MGNDGFQVDPAEEMEPVEGESRRGIAAAFTKHMHRTPGSKLGPRVWLVGLVVVLVAGAVIVVGLLSKPKAAAAQTTVAQTQSAPVPQQAGTPATRLPAPRTVVPPQADVNGQSWPQQDPGAGYAPPAVTVPGFVAPNADPPAVVTQAPPPRTVTAPPARPKPKAAAPARPAFSATTGYGCAENSGLVFTQHGFFTSGSKGWIRVNGGAYKGGTCDGKYDAMPMSGSATKDDNDNWASWQFRTGSVVKGMCAVSVFVPTANTIKDVGGHPSIYSIYNGFTTTGTAAWGTKIDQRASLGKWVTTKVNITHGAVAILLHSRGLDFTAKGPDYAHHAVAQVHVDCYKA